MSEVTRAVSTIEVAGDLTEVGSKRPHSPVDEDRKDVTLADFAEHASANIVPSFDMRRVAESTRKFSKSAGRSPIRRY